MSSVSRENTENSPLLKHHHDEVDSDHGENENRIARTNASDNDDQSPVSDRLTTSRLLLIQSGIWLGCFLAALDMTIIATLSATISSTFNSLSLLSWLASAYLIASAAIQPISGRLTDILSRRSGLLFSSVFFALGNLICGLAQSEWVMVFGRVVAGLGGGGLTAISTFVASDLIPLRERGMWQGFGNIFFGAGAALGGLVGGWINDQWNWRYAFLAQIPFTIISGLLVFFTVKVPIKQNAESTWKRIDFLGALTLISTLVLLLLGLNSGGNVVPWSHPLVISTLSLSAVSLAIFIYIENSYAMEPVIPVKLMLNRTVFSACLTNWFSTMCVFALLFYGPIYFQVKGLTPTQAGIRLIPQSVGIGLGSVLIGLLMNWIGRYYFLSLGAQIIFVTALVIFSTFSLATPVIAPLIAFFLVGIGYSGMLTTTLLALISAVDQKHHAVITSASYAFRSTGSAIGITVASVVFQNILDAQLKFRLMGREGAADVIQRLKDNLDEIQHVPAGWKEDVLTCYMDALNGVFWTTLGIGLLGLVASLGIRDHVLHRTLARK